jgi:hypothetical protein
MIDLGEITIFQILELAKKQKNLPILDTTSKNAIIKLWLSIVDPAYNTKEHVFLVKP